MGRRQAATGKMQRRGRGQAKMNPAMRVVRSQVIITELQGSQTGCKLANANGFENWLVSNLLLTGQYQNSSAAEDQLQ